MAAHRGPSSRWLFTREQLEDTPSRRGGIEADRELSYRQQAANLIQDIGQRLNVSQLIINTAIVYMHRFYMVHSFTRFHRNVISQTTLFLAAKVEEQPRKLEHVIKIAHACISPQEAALDSKSSVFQQQATELVALETIVLQTLGFEITVDHPHTDVVRCSQLVRASKDLAQTSYFMATNSLHLTTFCLQHRPPVVACVCIHLACKWSNWEIPVSTDGKTWWEYVDRSVTLEQLDDLTHEFLQILEKTPSRLKRIRNWRAIQAAKKPKPDGSAAAAAADAYQGTSLDGLPGSASFFPSSSDSAPFGSFQPLGESCDYEPFSEPLPSDFPPLKHKGGGASSKHSLAAAFSRPQKVLTLEKYREKHAAELAVQSGVKDDAPPPSHHHRKRSQQAGQSGDGRREKSRKARQSSFAENGEELKMRIKVSSEHRHGNHRVPSSHCSKRPHGDGAKRSGRGSSAHYDGGPRAEQHADYKDTFDMLDSLLSAQGMNL